jgi:hypothetical protein
MEKLRETRSEMKSERQGGMWRREREWPKQDGTQARGLARDLHDAPHLCAPRGGADGRVRGPRGDGAAREQRECDPTPFSATISPRRVEPLCREQGAPEDG